MTAGFEVLLGRSIDLVGTELPYQPFVEALRPLGEPRQVDGGTAGSQLRVFEDDAGAAHRARGRRARCCSCSRICTGPTPRRSISSSSSRTTSTTGRYSCSRPTAPTSPRRRSACAGSLTACAARARRSCSSSGRSSRDELAALLAAHAGARRPRRWWTRSSPARRATHSSPRSCSPPRRPTAASSRAASATCCCSASARLDRATQERAAPGRGGRARRRIPAAPRDRGAAGARAARLAPPGGGARRAGRRAGRRAASASATRCWRRRSTRRSSPASARSCTRGWRRSSRAAERRARRSWRPIGRRRAAAREALVASVEAAREAEAVFGLAEALAHLERALALWDAVPDAAELAGLDLAGLCAWAAELASQTGAAPRAVELAQTSDRSRRGDATRCARRTSTTRLGRYLHESGRTDAALCRVRAGGRARAGRATLRGARPGSGGARRTD